MISRSVLAVLLALVLFTARAQTPLGQPSLDESKVQMWCATVRFVYDDAGRPNLKSTVRCEGGNLDALAASIRPDSLRVYSLLYQPIEGRGAIYQGKKDNPARLAALAKAIVNKLKGSPARRKDPARMARVAALETALTNYVTSGTPMGEVSAAMAPEKADTAVAATAPGAPGPAEAAEAQAAAERDAAGTNPNASPAAGTESLLNRFAAPLALILGILSLVLYIMLRVTLGQWRRQQRRETLEAKQAATAAQAAAAETSAAVADSAARLKRAEALVLAGAPEPAATPALDRLSPAQRLEVERLVSQRVDEELRWLRANLPELVAEATGAAATPTAAPAPLPDAPATGQVADDVQMD
ncbi:hypothetical protein MON38_12115 [Hymenobacter sp. DH14]|uniref:Uncharacterized protein n=1 Tax=Hymenobacter cyanobacteriorum TaxID=2926463 RepID=A0A9X1VJH1_9BACT|nr:hypothetical protein [Hymenobacter cyanobacteriorum]MCI1188165.1 hypothetical protein [Hymenobacter cyanobacteriorum]